MHKPSCPFHSCLLLNPILSDCLTRTAQQTRPTLVAEAACSGKKNGPTPSACLLCAHAWEHERQTRRRAPDRTRTARIIVATWPAPPPAAIQSFTTVGIRPSAGASSITHRLPTHTQHDRTAGRLHARTYARMRACKPACGHHPGCEGSQPPRSVGARHVLRLVLFKPLAQRCSLLALGLSRRGTHRMGFASRGRGCLQYGHNNTSTLPAALRCLLV